MKSFVASIAIVALSFLSAGCRPDEKIRTYRVASPDTPAATIAEAQRTNPEGDPTDRLIGAIVPGPKQAWFFKAVGPAAAMADASEAIAEFLASVRMEGDEPIWTTPANWSERRGEGMRLATLEVPAGAGPIELSVIGLPLVGSRESQALDNVNRWRKQMRLGPLDAEGLSRSAKPLAEVADGALLVDATGWYDGGAMAPEATSTPPLDPPALPDEPRLAEDAPAGAELKGQTPDGWTEGPPSSMRKASLRTPGGAEVSAFAFPSVGAMGDPLENVNRWRGEVGLEPTSAAALGEEVEKVKLLGAEGSYYELVGPSETTHAAMVERDGQVWFFKMRGPGEAVSKEREAFRAWLESLSL